MLVVLLATMALALPQQAAPAAPPATGPGAELIEAVRASLDEVRRKHAALPPPKDDAERLVRMGELDQAPRKVMATFDFSRLPTQEREAAVREAVAPMEAADRENQKQLLEMLPPEGWFLKSRYGEQAARAAFHIVQHGDVTLQRRFLPKLEALAKSGEVEGQSFAMMFDRVAISEDRPQRYGTQFRCDGGKWRPYPLEDEARVEILRQEVGVGWTFAENKARVQSAPTCPQTRRPPPPGMKLD